MNSLWPRNTGSITHLQCVSMYLYIPQKYCFPPDLRCVQCSRENPGRLKSADKNTATYYVQSTSTKTQRQSTLKFKTYCVTVGCRTEEKGVGLSRGRNDHSDPAEETGGHRDVGFPFTSVHFRTSFGGFQHPFTYS